VTVCIYDDLVDSVRPGDRVLLTGIYRASTVRVNPRRQESGVVYRTYLDVLHVGKLAGKRITESGNEEL
jgi:DNA replication licensing factor MCM4